MVENTLLTVASDRNGRGRPILQGSDRWLTAHAEIIDWQQPLAVGFSGGADSTALLLALAEQHPKVEAWHIDHGWHDKSADQARQLARRCVDWGIPFRQQRVACSRSKNRESSARSARLQAFAMLAECRDINQVALAHHREDQAETVLMRMLHGDGVRGCCGIAPCQQMGGLRLLRPLLSCSRDDLHQSLLRSGVPFLQDPSNRDTTLRRNHLRLSVMPAMTRALQRGDAVSLMLRWQQQAIRLSDRISSLSERVVVVTEGDGVWVSWPQWAELPAAARAWTLQRMVQALHGSGVCLGRRHIELVESWLSHGGQHGLDLSRSRLQHRQRRLWLMKTGQCLSRNDILRASMVKDDEVT